jgi:hypothetical protein
MLVHERITDEFLARPFPQVIENMGQIQEVVLLKPSRQGRTPPIAEAAEMFLNKYYNRTKFDAIVQLLHPLYVGRRRIELTPLAQRLQAVHMTVRNNGSMMEYLSVQELLSQYQTLLTEPRDPREPTTRSDLPCLTNLFYNALSRRLKLKLHGMVPLTPPTSYANNLDRLLSFVDAAKQAERELKALAATALQTDGSTMVRAARESMEDQPAGETEAVVLLSSNKYEENWRALGYHSREQQEMILAIANPETSKSDRSALITALLTHSAAEEPTETHPRKKSRIFFAYRLSENSGRNTWKGGDEARRVVAAPPISHYRKFPISEGLPFIDLPIGRENNVEEQHIYLRGLADTGGCCTMAWRPYMLRLKELFPELVAEHIVLKESRFEDIKIGGITGRVWITELLTFYIPFARTNGETHGIMFGLTEDLPINVLYGLPFFLQAQITLNLGELTATSKVLATTFRLNMLPPERAEVETIDYKVGSTATYHHFHSNNIH